MATVFLAPTFGVGYQAFSTTGLPLNAGLVYTYASGTTTPTASYTTSAGNVQNANPIVLGADGRPANEIWLVTGTAYTFVVKDSAGNTIATYDAITGINDPGSHADWAFTGNVTVAGNVGTVGSFTATFTGCTTAPTFTINYTKIGNVVVLSFPSSYGAIAGTSNSTAKTLTGMPAAIRPSSHIFGAGAAEDAGAVTYSPAFYDIDSSGVITLAPTLTSFTWTNSGACKFVPFFAPYTTA